MSSSLTLDSSYTPGAPGPGHVRLRLVNAGRETFTGFRLGFTSVTRLTPSSEAALSVVEQIGSYHELAAPAELDLGPGEVWALGPFECDMPMTHANDGPVRAFLIRGDGSTTEVRVPVTERVPRVRVGGEAAPAAQLASGGDDVERAWAVASDCEQRLHPDDGRVLTGAGGAAVEARIDESSGPESFSVDGDRRGGFAVTAGSRIALQWAFIDVARRLRGEIITAESRFEPRYGFRAVMIDVSRHFVPAVDVGEVIDLAAWRRLNVVHLHLTDDQSWRVPIGAHPALADVGAWRGFGLPIPPLHGSGADPYGGCYTGHDIGGWVTRAADLGIELVPEIDVPGHSYAAIAALPELRDPDDTGSVLSVQSFPRNVLNPGLPATRAFLEAVFGALADLFPGSPMHIGCDEVPNGVWDRSPAAQRWAAARGLDGHHAIECAFVADIVELVRSTTGRSIGAWQEAALLGGLRPGDGYVIGWTDNETCRRLAEDGHDVVAGAAAAYYLDMATGPEWDQPGHWWAGSITTDTIAAFDPTAGWDDADRSRVIGIQASLWGEHVPDRRTMRTLLLPRLDTFAATGWHTS